MAHHFPNRHPNASQTDGPPLPKPTPNRFPNRPPTVILQRELVIGAVAKQSVSCIAGQRSKAYSLTIQRREGLQRMPSWQRLCGLFFFSDTKRRAVRAARGVAFLFFKNSNSEADIRNTLACDVARGHAIAASELLPEV